MLALLAGATPLALAALTQETEAQSSQRFIDYAWTAAGGTTARTGPAHEGDFLSLKDFGAVGNGTADDGPAWTTAIATGSHLFVPPGTYKIGNAVGAPTTGQRIYGVPGQSIITKTTTGTNYILPHLLINNVSNVVIDGLTFTVPLGVLRQYAIINGALSTTSTAPILRTTVRNCIFNNCAVIISRLSDTVWIQDNAFLGGGATGSINGISTGGNINPSSGGTDNTNGLVSNIFITGNLFSSIRQEPIDLNWDTQNVIIDSNILYDSGLTGAGQPAEMIDIGGGGTLFCKHIRVTSNLIWMTSANTAVNNGITVKLSSDDVVIANNTIRCDQVADQTAYGILVGSNSTNVQLLGNYITGFKRGINTENNVSHLIISNNIVTANGDEGINITNPHNTVTDNQAINNAVVTDTSYGFNFAATANYSVITGNKSFDTRGGSATQNGFTFAAADRCIVNDNIAFPVKATGFNGTGALTNSLVGTAGNIP